MKKKIIMGIVIILLLAAATLFLGYKFIKIEDVTVEGLNRQTSEKVLQYIFENNPEKSSLRLFVDMLRNKKASIPFIEDYDIEFISPSKISINVYEKSIVGYIECMGQKWYFDKDGIAVESTSELFEGIPQITGLKFDYIVIGEQIPLDDKEIFDRLLELTQLIRKYQLDISRVNIDSEKNLRIYLGEVRVELGTGDMLNEKIIDLYDMSSKLENVPGALDMREYDENRKGYTFKKDSN